MMLLPCLGTRGGEAVVLGTANGNLNEQKQNKKKTPANNEQLFMEHFPNTISKKTT